MNKKGFGTILLLVLVAIAGVAAVIAFRFFDLGKLKTANDSINKEDPIVEEFKVLGASDKVEDIEKYLDQTNLEKIDVEMTEVDKNAGSL